MLSNTDAKKTADMILNGKYVCDGDCIETYGQYVVLRKNHYESITFNLYQQKRQLDRLKLAINKMKNIEALSAKELWHLLVDDLHQKEVPPKQSRKYYLKCIREM